MLTFLQNVIGNGNNGFTEDGGMYITLVNDTGSTSVKGTIVSASLTANNAARITPANYDQAIGVIVDNGVQPGALMKVAVSGKAYVLLQDGLAGTRGYWCGVSSTAGRMYQLTDPPSTTEHSREIGHCLQTVTAGVNKLCLVDLHFN